VNRSAAAARILVLLVLSLLSVAAGQAQDVFEDNKGKAVFIEAFADINALPSERLDAGSGMLFKGGYVLTARHFINAGAVKGPGAMVFFGHMGDVEAPRYQLSYVAEDEDHDLLLLRFSTPEAEKWPFLCRRSPDNPIGRTGAITVIGFPLVADLSAGAGTPMHALDTRSGEVSSVTTNQLLTEMNLTHGQSGAPVLDQDGAVVGMVRGEIKINGVQTDTSVIVPIERAERILPDLAKGANCHDAGIAGAFTTDYAWSHVINDVHGDLGNPYYIALGMDHLAVYETGSSSPVYDDTCNAHGAAIFSYREPFAALACDMSLQLVNLSTGVVTELPVDVERVPQTVSTRNIMSVGAFITAKHAGLPCLYQWDFDWNDATRSTLHSSALECDSEVAALAASSNGWLAVGTSQGRLRLYSEYDGSIFFERQLDDQHSQSYQSNSIGDLQLLDVSQMGGTGMKMAFHSWSNIAYVIEIPDMMTYDVRRFVYGVDTAVIFGSALSNDGSLLAIATSDGAVTIYDVESGDQVGQYFHDDAVEDVTFNYYGEVVVSVGDDGFIRTYRVNSRSTVAAVELRPGANLESVDYYDGRIAVGQGWLNGPGSDGKYLLGEWKLSASGALVAVEH
jgi:WD40 repeat protein